jgi:hypothetical protein
MPPKIILKEKWYNNPWTKVSGALIVIFSFFGMGFQTGMMYSKNERILDEIKVRTEYETKIQQVIDECRSEKIIEYKKVTERLESTINKFASKK